MFAYAGERRIPLYVLIDEYDNFANTILAHDGEASYRSFTHGGGFYRNFFATLKGGAGQGGGLERLFVTGVSPITLDDVTSGFNIGRNVSLHPDFNELLGFTEPEVLGLLRMYRSHGVFSQDIDAALAVMRAWYNGYRFAGSAETEVYNPDMVLYYLNESMPNRPVPDDLIDVNVRIDYGKLRHLLVVGRRLNGNFDLLQQVIGEEAVETPVQTGFPLERLDQPENFLSLLHYFGLLSIRQVVGGVPRLGIPNQTVRRLLYGYLRDAYRDVEVFSVNLFTFERLLRRMANEGVWEPVVGFLRDAIAAQTGVRDYMVGEKVIQGFLAAYLSVTDHFVFRSEAELGKGHADICLEPLVARYPHLRHGFLIALKYIKRSEGARRDPGRGRGGRGVCAVAAVPCGRTPGAPVSRGAVHGSGGGVPRVGDGGLRAGVRVVAVEVRRRATTGRRQQFRIPYEVCPRRRNGARRYNSRPSSARDHGPARRQRRSLACPGC